MKKLLATGILSSLFGGLLGAGALWYYQNNYSDDPVYEPKEESIHIIPVSEQNQYIDNASCCNDLTYASEQAVNTVVHIESHFVREGIVYDPFLELFFGEDAHQIRKQEGIASASGVIISPDGYIVTNNHVIKDAVNIKVIHNGNKYAGKIIGSDPSTDLAILKIEAKNLDFVGFGNSDELKLGEWVLAVGNPLNLQTTITAGIVSARNRNIDLLTSEFDPEKNVFPIESFIQTDAAVNPGNSGGALINRGGELVGINTAIASGSGFYTGYSFAIPSNIVKKVSHDIILYGEVKRVKLGIIISENNKDIAQKRELKTNKGIVITEVLKAGVADRSELKENDIILAIGEKAITSVPEFQGIIAVHNPGDVIYLQILRGDDQKEVKIQL